MYSKVYGKHALIKNRDQTPLIPTDQCQEADMQGPNNDLGSTNALSFLFNTETNDRHNNNRLVTINVNINISQELH